MPLRTDPSHYLQPLGELARLAGERILDIYNSEFQVEEKGDKSPLTAADLAAHECLLAGLAGLTPVYPVLSEESASLDYAVRQGWKTYWLVDPLDGTKEFVKRNGEFTVNVALIHRGVPVLGIVHAPALGVTYFACENCGAFRQEGAESPVPIRVTVPAANPLRVVGSRSHNTVEMELFLSRLGEHECVPMGSSLKFCLVAEGKADIYPRIGLTSEWDTAAAQCVVEQAGGAVVDLDGKPLRYNSKPSILNPYFLVYGDRGKDWTRYAGGIVG